MTPTGHDADADDDARPHVALTNGGRVPAPALPPSALATLPADVGVHPETSPRPERAQSRAVSASPPSSAVTLAKTTSAPDVTREVPTAVRDHALDRVDPATLNSSPVAPWTLDAIDRLRERVRADLPRRYRVRATFVTATGDLLTALVVPDESSVTDAPTALPPAGQNTTANLGGRTARQAAALYTVVFDADPALVTDDTRRAVELAARREMHAWLATRLGAFDPDVPQREVSVFTGDADEEEEVPPGYQQEIPRVHPAFDARAIVTDDE